MEENLADQSVHVIKAFNYIAFGSFWIDAHNGFLVGVSQLYTSVVNIVPIRTCYNFWEVHSPQQFI
jgi:hypothetical protein